MNEETLDIACRVHAEVRIGNERNVKFLIRAAAAPEIS